ncbi:Gem-associated protein 7 [Mizuhopecten yessoensis]|uniref:Gem-associated protein 7 n=1 Tax=Mizuhopecten yessoensis TaxID=6573 RepID=A0A210QK98_MIZYE|nr:Gem-associated protein 7 [Mizuhopecten yessoensis]
MDTDLSKQQEHRTLLRERFLRVMATTVGQDAFIKMHEKTNVSCKLGPVDLDIQHIQVTDLLTPMGTVPNAILRTSDMFGIRVDNLKLDQS